MRNWLKLSKPDAEAALIIRLWVRRVDRWTPLQRVGLGGRWPDKTGVAKRKYINNDMLSAVDFETRQQKLD